MNKDQRMPAPFELIIELTTGNGHITILQSITSSCSHESRINRNSSRNRDRVFVSEDQLMRTNQAAVQFVLSAPLDWGYSIRAVF